MWETEQFLCWSAWIRFWLPFRWTKPINLTKLQTFYFAVFLKFLAASFMQTLFGKRQRCCCWKWKWSSISQMKATKSMLNFNVLHIYHMPQGTMDSLEVILLCIQIFWSFAVISSICEFGERLWSIRVVFVAARCTTHALNSDLCSSEINWATGIWQYFVWPNHSQKCE